MLEPPYPMKTKAYREQTSIPVTTACPVGRGVKNILRAELENKQVTVFTKTKRRTLTDALGEARVNRCDRREKETTVRLHPAAKKRSQLLPSPRQQQQQQQRKQQHGQHKSCKQYNMNYFDTSL